MNRLDQYRTLIHWGTSTWTYPEWQGIVYHQPYTAKTIKSESLAEYAAFPQFSTVGIDNTPVQRRGGEESQKENEND